jgi:hypothetical protein
MKKQTAVEWFAQWLNDNPVVYQKDYYAAIEWAKAMEKEQIMSAYWHGSFNWETQGSTKYYTETYGGDE